MAEYPVLHSQWLFGALFGGTVLLLMFVLCYWALWKPLKDEKVAEQQDMKGARSFFAWLLGIAPWVIILAVLGTVVYTIIHTGIAAVKTPNW